MYFLYKLSEFALYIRQGCACQAWYYLYNMLGDQPPL